MPIKKIATLIINSLFTIGVSFGKLIRKDMNLRDPLTDCLIGNIDDKDFSNLFRTMSEFADLPDPVNYGDVLRTA